MISWIARFDDDDILLEEIGEYSATRSSRNLLFTQLSTPVANKELIETMLIYQTPAILGFHKPLYLLENVAVSLQ